MEINLKILKSKIPNDDGYPIIFEISHQNKRRQIEMGRCQLDHFLPDEKSISRRHPHFDILEPIIKEFKLKAKKIVLSKITDVDLAKKMLLQSESPEGIFALQVRSRRYGIQGA